jgi:nitrogen regulatory protein P-II 1
VQSAGSGKIGDGKIFLYRVEEAIRIRNQERGVAAL